MRTPEEVKDGIVKAIETASWVVEGGDAHDLLDAVEQLHATCTDALALIRQLERERDAAIADVKSLCSTNYFSGNFCEYCKHNEPDGQCHHHCIPYSSEWGWEWRGVKEVEE